MQLTEQQIRFFETWGYLHFPGLLADRISWIEEQYNLVWKERGVNHTGEQRSCIVPFIDQRAEFCTLLDDSRLVGLAEGVLGPNFNYLGGDGNWYSGDTPWHSDGFHDVARYLKIAIYLDPLTRDTGCLRVIPGTHRLGEAKSWEARQARNSLGLWGVEQNEVPALALETQPGDVVAFNHNLMHASFGGSTRRRMFTLNLCNHAEKPEEVKDLVGFINAQARFWIDTLHSEAMRATASPERMRHLRQVLENEGELAGLAAKARREMPESARG